MLPPSQDFSTPFAASVSKAHGRCPAFTLCLFQLPCGWQRPGRRPGACRQQELLPVDCPPRLCFSSEGPVGSGTPLAGISGRRSFPPVQTHLPDKRGFESLQTPSVACSRRGDLLRSHARHLSEGQAVGSGSAAGRNRPPTMQSTGDCGQMQRRFCSSEIIIFLCVCRGGGRGYCECVHAHARSRQGRER